MLINNEKLKLDEEAHKIFKKMREKSLARQNNRELMMSIALANVKKTMEMEVLNRSYL